MLSVQHFIYIIFSWYTFTMMAHKRGFIPLFFLYINIVTLLYTMSIPLSAIDLVLVGIIY